MLLGFHFSQIYIFKQKPPEAVSSLRGFLLLITHYFSISYTSFSEGIILLRTQKIMNGVAATVNAPNKPSR